jgi:hypothetical protein
MGMARPPVVDSHRRRHSVGPRRPLLALLLIVEAPRAAKNAPYEIELDATARPPRKPTRRSPTHLKTDSTLRVTAMVRNASPQARASRRD